MEQAEKIEAIKRQIIAEATAEARQAVSASEQWAAEHQAEAQKEADAEVGRMFKAAEAEGEARARKIISAAEIEQRSQKLRKQAELMEDAISFAAGKLDTIRQDPNYSEFIKALIIEAALKLGEEEVDVLIDRRDAAIVTQDFLSSIEIIFTFSYNLVIKLDLGESFIETSGGAILRSKRGNVMFNNTFEERLKGVAGEVKRALAAELF